MLLHGTVSTITAFKAAVITAKVAVRNLKAANLSNKNAQMEIRKKELDDAIAKQYKARYKGNQASNIMHALTV